MSRISQLENIESCSSAYVLAVNDAMNTITGKWKLPIIGALLFGKKRFSELQRDIPKISPRMLSKELKDLEMNGIILRSVYDTIPVTVEYELTASGEEFKKVLDSMIEWGLQHRERIIGNGQ